MSASSKLLFKQARERLRMDRRAARRGRADALIEEERHLREALSRLRSPSNITNTAERAVSVKAILDAGLFDADYYLQQASALFPNLQLNDCPAHYLMEGWLLLCDPHPMFSVAYYLTRYPDVLSAGYEPLTHYVAVGSSEMRDPHPLFLNYHYWSQTPLEYRNHSTVLGGALASRPHLDAINSPHPLFCLDDFNKLNASDYKDSITAIIAYSTRVSNARRLSYLFDEGYYLNQISLEIQDLSPYVHYAVFGVLQRIDPSPLFDSEYYRTQASDCDLSLDPLVHYLWKGERFQLAPHRLFSPEYYAKSYLSADSSEGALYHYTRIGIERNFAPHPAFETSSTLEASNPAETRIRWERLFEDGAISLQEEAAPLPEDGHKSPKMLSSAVSAIQMAPRALRGSRDRDFEGSVPFKPDQHTIILISHFVGPEIFGSERSFIDMVQAASATSVNVVVVLPKNFPEYSNLLRAISCRVYVREFGWWRAGQPITAQWIDTFVSLYTHERPAAVHINTIMLREPAIAARRLGITIITHIRELIENDAQLCALIGHSPREIERKVKERTDWVVANSVATSLAYTNLQNSVVIPNAVDLSIFADMRFETTEYLRVGLISSNVEKKGLLDFVILAKQCEYSIPKARFHLIGPDSTIVTRLKQQQVEGKMPANLIFCGYAKSPAEAVAQVDVVVNFSHFAESFGRTILEAMAAGRPTIVYNWGALPELVRDGETGYIIPYLKPEAAVTAIRALAEDADHRRKLGIAAQKRSRLYDLEHYRAKVAKMYERVIGGQPKVADNPLVMKARAWEKAYSPSLRIAYFCWHFPVPSETFVLAELEALVAAGLDVLVFCRESPHKHFEPSFLIKYERVATEHDLAAALVRTKRTVVHAHFVYPTVTNMVWPACEKANVPFTFIAHAQDIFKHENVQVARLNEIGASSMCRRLFTLSNYHYEYLLALGFPREKLSINPNAVTAERFPQRSDRFRATPARIISIGRFVEKKGFINLVRAATVLQKLDVQFELYGYGELENELRAAVSDLGLSNVLIAGPVSQAEVAELMATSDAFIAPSVRTANGDQDGIPTTLIESMLTGLPVIATAIAGIPDLVLDGITGLIAESGPAGIAAAVHRFLALEDLELRAIVKAARERAERLHNAKRTTRLLRRVWTNEPVDVVVVSWNNLAELRLVVDRILSFTAAPLHLIVCDNDSRTEDVSSFLREAWKRDDRITVVMNPVNAFVGPATNLAADQGFGREIIYVCAKEGISFASGWEQPLIVALETDDKLGQVGSLGYSPAYLDGESYAKGISLFSKFRNRAFAAENPTRPFFHVQGGLFAFSRRMYDEIGGFSTEVPHSYTDVEFSYYVESRGWRLGEVAGVAAYFNKTRPSLSQRFTEDIIAAHPVLPHEVDKYECLRNGSLKHCNLCDWHGERLIGGLCPSCLSDGMDRTLFAWLSTTNLMYRRAPTLGVGLTPPMERLWAKQFQGPRLSLADLINALGTGGRLSNRSGGLHAGYLRCHALEPDDAKLVLTEFARILKPGAPFALQLAAEGAGAWDEVGSLCVAIADAAGLRFTHETNFSRRSLGLDYRPLWIFERRA